MFFAPYTPNFTIFAYTKLATMKGKNHNPLYENSLKYYRDMENSLDLKYAKGLQEGKLEVVKNAIAEGLPNHLITKLTRLSLAEIEEIRKEMK